MIRGRTDNDESATILVLQLLEQFHDREKRVVARFNETILVTFTDDPGFFAFSETEVGIPRRSFFPTVKSFELRLRVNRTALTVLDNSWGTSNHIA